VRETTLQTPKVSEEGVGRSCSRCRSRDSSLAVRDEDHVEADCFPAAHGGPWWSRYPPAACGRPHTRTGGCLKEAVTPWGAALEQAPARTCRPVERRSHPEAGLLVGLVTPWGTHAGAACS